jgi:hypothetical protein
MVVAASEEMAEFVGEENEKKSEGERETGGQAERVLVKESEGAEKFVGGKGLVLSVGGGELGSGDEASAEREKEEDASEEKHSPGRTVGDRGVADTIGRGAPIDVRRYGWRWIFWRRWGHGIFCARIEIGILQYSIA